MLVAYSHLRWNFVWQRPQHLLSRFARHMPVLVVEEPRATDGQADLLIRSDHGVTIATPLLAKERCRYGFGPDANSAIAQLIAPLVPSESALTNWYYTPMALGAEPPSREPVLTVYDAMDDLASFLSAPPMMRELEARLLREVDLVFTGGPTLYRQRRSRHPAVHCFPSGVDREHFAAAMNGIIRPAALAARPRPILGYYGVIDERLDLDLLAEIADLRPSWTIALVGPLAKISPSDLPNRENIVYFGQQEYADLPGYLACFDVALMPFALNEATRAISPTKTLEYLAGGKPVVSTPVADVIDLYGDVVSVATSAREVVAAAEAILRLPDEARRVWHTQAQRLVRERAWDLIAAEMLALMGRTARYGRPAGELAPVALMA